MVGRWWPLGVRSWKWDFSCQMWRSGIDAEADGECGRRIIMCSLSITFPSERCPLTRQELDKKSQREFSRKVGESSK